jgi:hypothetical protein
MEEKVVFMRTNAYLLAVALACGLAGTTISATSSSGEAIQRTVHGTVVATNVAVDPQIMEAQHAFDAHRWMPRPLGLEIDWLDHSHQVHPGHHLVHLIEKPLAAGGLVILIKCDFGKRLLGHGAHLLRSQAPSFAHLGRGINQAFFK